MGREGKVEEAALVFEAAAIKTGSAFDYYNAALAYSQLGQTDKVSEALQQAVSRLPTFSDAWINLGVFLQSANEMGAAVRCYTAASRTSTGGKRSLALFNIGSLYLRAGDTHRAHIALAAAVHADPKLAVAADSLGSVYAKKGHTKTAQSFFKRALELQPDLAESYFNLGGVERQRGNWNKAVDYLQMASMGVSRGSGDPRMFLSQVYNNLGGALHAVGRYEEALGHFDKAIEMVPDMVMAYINKGESLRILGRWDDAIVCTRIATTLDQEHGVALSNHIMYKQNVCDWRDIDRHMSALLLLLSDDDMTQTDPTEDATPTVSPYQAVTFPFTPAQTLVLLRVYARDILARAAKIKRLVHMASPAVIGASVDGSRLHLAYVSSDYSEHTTGVNVAGIFGLHDRRRVHVHAYATSPSDGSGTRTLIENSAETFRDFTELSAAQMAFAINTDGIHVLVDFNGHTLGARSLVTALRPAPVTLFDQGFAGSSGGVATHFNADKISLPPELVQFHTERILYMPHFSNPLNNHRSTSAHLVAKNLERLRRQDIGLPPGKFLYGCFNTGYKYDGDVLDAWSDVLKANARAALWLLRWPDCEQHLRREARARGLRNESVVFVDVLPKETHLRWKSLADLFLDTFAFNGHGTLSQMLWMGVPTLTRPAERIGQRIGAAVVLASAAPELVALTREDYVQLATALGRASGRVKLAKIRERLETSRWSGAPLFDIEAYVRDYERLLMSTWDSYTHTGEYGEGGEGAGEGGGKPLSHVVVSASPAAQLGAD